MEMKRAPYLIVLLLIASFGCIVRIPSTPSRPGRQGGELSLPAEIGEGGLSAYEHRELAPGVEYLHAHLTDLFGKVNDLHVVRIDLEVAEVEPAIHPKATDAYGNPDGKERRTTSDVAREYRALVAVNGGFFTWEKLLPCAVQKVDGKQIPSLGRLGHGLAFSGRDCLFMGPLDEEALRKYDNAICGDPLLQDGRCLLPGERNDAGPAPRTLLGLAPGKVLYILVIDGRHRGVSHGINYWEAADLLRAFDCRDGFALDGGGSTTLVVREEPLGKGDAVAPSPSIAPSVRLLNTPSDGKERKVIDHFLILDRHSIHPARK